VFIFTIIDFKTKNFTTIKMENQNKNSYLIPFILVTSLFFLWGLANSLNGSLIKHFQTALDLSRAQAGIVDSAFYIGYFVMALPAGLVMQKYGYKKGIIAGLLMYALGALLFYPAADWRAYGFFLFALFVIASGLAFLETAANLYMTVMGDEKSGSWRVNFAQSFNGLSIILGPIIGSLFIFSEKEYTRDQLNAMPIADAEAIRIAEAHSVQTPYLFIAGLVLFVAFLFAITKMPEIGGNNGTATGSTQKASFRGLFRHRHLVLGAIAQFCYCGGQTAIWGYFVDFKQEVSNESHVGIVNSIYQITDALSLKQIASYHASAAFVLFMIGRFTGTWLMKRIAPERMLMMFAIGVIAFLSAAILTSGLVAVVCFMIVYFFMSIMFPTIFALSTRGLPAQEAKLGSSLIIMSIVGAAFVPPLTGLIFQSQGAQIAMVLPLLCFLYILFYSINGYKIENEGAVKISGGSFH
jgi:MFS transporter, FHS family, L-fucose permease